MMKRLQRRVKDKTMNIGPSILEMREAIRCLSLGKDNDVAKATLDYCVSYGRGESVDLALQLLNYWCISASRTESFGKAFEEVFGVTEIPRQPEHICWDCCKPCFKVTDVSGFLVGECCENAYTLG